MMIKEKRNSIFAPANTCMYCGAPLDEYDVCDCQERKSAFIRDCENARRLRLDHNLGFGLHEILTVKTMETGSIELAYTMYKMGIIRGIAAEQNNRVDSKEYAKLIGKL